MKAEYLNYIATFILVVLFIKMYLTTHSNNKLIKTLLVKDKDCAYIIVLHFWFMDSKGFQIIYSDATTKEEAFREACALKERKESTFNKCAATVVPIYKKDLYKELFSIFENAKK